MLLSESKYLLCKDVSGRVNPKLSLLIAAFNINE